MDDKGVLLSSRTINVLPKSGEKFDVNNLLSEKFLFDLPTINPGVKLPSKLFSEVDEFSVLVLETTDLFVSPSHRILFILKGDTPTVIHFDSDKVNTKVNEDGGIVIPKENNLIRIELSKTYEIFVDNGVTLVGYGFGLKTVFIEKKIKLIKLN